ncbi:MAG: RNA-binding transcriptional accessory protein, partial [Bacteroidia bacterium]|nr:RNA-binding transcriptional accessory protein [Bacteroidia bacterium]
MSHTGIAINLGLNANSVKTVLDLFDQKCTIPFIARYRKDKTGGLDEVAIENIQKEFKRLKELELRKEFILETIKSQGKLTNELSSLIINTSDIQTLEDLYLPYKQRRKTKGDIARENGLESLAKIVFNQRENNPSQVAFKYFNDKIKTKEDALSGARDIIAEWINEDLSIRNKLRERFEKHGILSAKLVKSKEVEAQKFKDYFNYSEKNGNIPSHRIMAVFRGVDEGYLRFAIEPDEALTLEFLERQTVKFRNDCGIQVQLATRDAYKRLLQPSLETELKNNLWDKAEQKAIDVFAENLKQLLLSAPLGAKRVMAIDPGIRTGCKVVCLDEKGTLLKNDVIYIHEGKERTEKAATTIKNLCTQFHVEAFAIGDGTAGRETEQFINSLNLNLPLFMVNEDGASVYSASEAAREEFPNEDVTVRGAVSIGRRLMDPLAELVKIDPKSIGVGQYQHDVNAVKLKDKLDQTVMNCVNAIGVNLNTASRHLLSYVSGLGPAIAQNIITYRKENGAFKNRNELKKVTRLGSKAFEQCAGFLRITSGNDILDSSGVHPENYGLVKTIAKDAGISPSDLIANEKVIAHIDWKKYVNETVGELTIKDILTELKKPGLDPREEAVAFQYAAGIYKIDDLSTGMLLPGIVTNITQFGAFIDIGVKQDGLVHVSQL